MNEALLLATNYVADHAKDYTFRGVADYLKSQGYPDDVAAVNEVCDQIINVDVTVSMPIGGTE
jgi:hypothetical protein